MSFSISFVPHEQIPWESDPEIRYGLIRIGDFGEHFQVEIGYWTEQMYSAHWRDALRRLVEGAESSCLITAVKDPAQSSFVVWWLLYRNGFDIRVQQAFGFYREMTLPFNPSLPYRSIPPHRRLSEEGDPISEWATTVKDIASFLES